MKASLISLFLSLIVAVIVGAVLIRHGMAQSRVTAVERMRETTSETPFLIVGDVTVISGPRHERQVSVFIEPQLFTLENIKEIFLHLSEERPSEDSLSINAVSNAEQLKEALSLFAEIQSFPFGNVPPRPNTDRAANEQPLSSHYSRTNGAEYINYYAKDGQGLHIDLKKPSPGCAPSGDPIADLVDASMRGCEEVVRELLHGGADPNVKTKDGGVALVEASYWGPEHPKIVRRLLDAGANIDQTSSSGWTALMAAVNGNRSRTIDLLLSHGSNVNVISEDGRNALILGALKQNHSAVRKLLAHRADLNVTDGYGKTALSIAEEQHDEELIRILKKAGAVR